MIDRENYHLVYRHLAYRKNVMQNDPGTIATYWQSLKHLMQWAGARNFQNAPKIIPSFPEYLLTARNDGNEKTLTPKYMGKVLSHARALFDWARLYERGFSGISEAWINTLQVRRSAGTQSRLQERHYWKLDDVLKIAHMKPESLRERRDIAATCFLFMSGMRIGALVTLPVECVDLERMRIEQLPEKGVHTKNSKAAVTFLVNMHDDLFKIVEEWDSFVRREGSPNWYAAISLGDVSKKTLTTEKFSGATRKDYQGRTYAFSQGLQLLCEKAGIVYKSPHKLRHGFGVFGVRHAQNIGQMKAISQNLMHANLGITDGIYGRLAEDDLSEILSDFGRQPINSEQKKQQYKRSQT